MIWGRISNGWISMDYVTVGSQTTQSPVDTGTVSTDGSTLRIRSGAGSNYTITGYLNNGTRVEILEKKSVNGGTWGRVTKGWIMLDFVKLDSNTNSGSDNNTGSSDNSGNNVGTTTETKTGTVTLTSGTLNVRAGAGTNHRVVSYLVNGAKVTILETTVDDGVSWGRTATGWVCMDYIK